MNEVGQRTTLPCSCITPYFVITKNNQTNLQMTMKQILLWITLFMLVVTTCFGQGKK